MHVTKLNYKYFKQKKNLRVGAAILVPGFPTIDMVPALLAFANTWSYSVLDWELENSLVSWLEKFNNYM